MSAKCRFCSKEFSSNTNLRRHSMEVHGVDDTHSDYGKIRYKCLEGCDLSFEVHSELVTHLQTFHGILIEKEEITFNCESDYSLWLKSIFNTQHSEYAKSQRRLDENTEIIRYSCLCAEQHSQEEEILNRKHKLSNQLKSSRACTSQILVKKQNDFYMVTFFKTHYAHNVDKYNESVPCKRRCFDPTNQEHEPHEMITFDILHEEMETELSNIQKNMYNVIDIHTLSKALNVLQNTNDYLVTNFDHFEYFYDNVDDIEVVIDDLEDEEDMIEGDEINGYYVNTRDDMEINSKGYMNSNPSMEKGEVIISNDSQFDHSYFLCH